MKRVVSLLILCLMMTSIIGLPIIYANPETSQENSVVEPVIVSILNKKEGSPAPVLSIIEIDAVAEDTQAIEGQTEIETKKILAFSEDGQTPLFTVESPEYLAFQKAIIEDVTKKAISSFEEVIVSNVTQDYIEIDFWADFIQKYDIDNINLFPNGNINIEFGNYSFVLRNTNPAKLLVKDLILPSVITAIKDTSISYPMYKYALDIKSGSLLKDYEFDLNSVRVVKTVYPFKTEEKLIVYNNGINSGVTFSNEYTEILRGYLESSKTEGNTRSIKGNKPGCVDVRANVVILGNVKDLKITDKYTADYKDYTDREEVDKIFSVRLDTKDLVDRRNITTENILNYKDFHLNLDNLLLVPTMDSVVVLQPTYVECFRYSKLNKSMGRTLDVTKFVTTGEPVLTVVGSNEEVALEKFVNDNGYAGTELGNAPFLIYYNPNNLDYERIVEWMYSKNTTINETDRDALLSSLKNKFKSEGKTDELDSYLKAAGQMTDGTKKVIVLVVLLVIILAIILIVVISKASAKKSNIKKNTQGGLLFEEEGNDFEDDDDTGNFEFQ